MSLPKKGNRPRGDSKKWRDEIYESSHTRRHCPHCGIVTAFEVKEKYSFCIKCGRYYNRMGTKALTTPEIGDLFK